MDRMTKEESYEDRRLLFKNIWETAMMIDEKDAETLMAKPKVIKTLRLDEVDKYAIGKRKNERIRNLRTVCKKILDFCDRQDADDKYYEKRGIEETGSEGEEQPKFEFNIKKAKAYRRRKKTKRAKRLLTAKKPGHQAAAPERNDEHPKIIANSSRNNSHNRKKRPPISIVQRASIVHRTPLMPKVKSNPDQELSNSPAKRIAPTRKVLRKKRTKRKRSLAPNWAPAGTSGSPNPNVISYSQPKTGGFIVKSIRQFLKENKIEVISTN